MTLLLVLTLSLATVLTAVISGVVGMAGGITLLSFMTFFLTIEQIIPIHGIVQLASNSSRTLFLRKSVHKKITTFFFLGAPLGTFIAFKLITFIPDKKYFLIPIAFLIFYTLFKPKKLPPLKIPFWGFIPLGILTGIMGPLVGATGPLLAPFFLRDDLNKEEIVATKAVTQTFGHLLKIPLFLKLGFNYQSYWILLVAMVLSAIIGTKLGVTLLGRVSEKFFKLIYQTALFLAGMRILYKIFLV